MQPSVPSQMPQQAVVMQATNGQPMQRQIQHVQHIQIQHVQHISTGSLPLSADTNVLQQAVQVSQYLWFLN